MKTLVVFLVIGCVSLLHANLITTQYTAASADTSQAETDSSSAQTASADDIGTYLQKARLPKRIHDVEGIVKETTDDVEIMRSDHETLERKVDEQKTHLKDADVALEELIDQKTSANRDSIHDLTNSVNSNHAKATTNDRRIDELSGRITRENDNLENSDAQLRSDIARVEREKAESIENVDNKVLTLNGDVTGHNQRIGAVEQGLGRLRTDSTNELNQAFNELVDKIDTEATRVTTLENQARTTQTRLVEAEARLSKFQALHPVAKSCKEAKLIGGYTQDAHYWLHPEGYFGKRIVVWCDAMDTDEPKEYISLYYPNSGKYPDEFSCNTNTRLRTNLQNRRGVWKYDKIRIDSTLTVIDEDREDFRKVTSTWGVQISKPYRYAEAADCYCTNTYKGFFVLNLEGTGLKFKGQLSLSQWKVHGWYPKGHLVRYNDQKYQIYCGGYCGGCYRTQPLQLEPMNEDDAKFDAIVVQWPTED